MMHLLIQIIGSILAGVLVQVMMGMDKINCLAIMKYKAQLVQIHPMQIFLM